MISAWNFTKQITSEAFYIDSFFYSSLWHLPQTYSIPPKCLGVIFYPGMNEFVYQDIINHFIRQSDQVHVEADIINDFRFRLQ